MVISGFLLLFPAVNINISKYLSFFFFAPNKQLLNVVLCMQSFRFYNLFYVLDGCPASHLAERLFTTAPTVFSLLQSEF